jgi:transcriptional regulator with XRE-family HTH domain
MERNGRNIPNGRMRNKRKTSGLTLTQVSHLIDMKSPRHVSDWENGRVIPTIKKLFRLARLYNCLVEDLYLDLWQEVGREMATEKKRKEYLRYLKNKKR